MLYIIAGERNEGKTRAAEELFIRLGGDGIISPKVISGGSFTGYEARRLSTGERMPLAAPAGSTTPNWDEAYRQGSFSFSRKGLEFACRVLEEIFVSGISPVFIDEVGPLELSGRGFTCVTPECVNGRDVYLTVRTRLAGRVIDIFRPGSHRIIPAVNHLLSPQTIEFSRPHQ